MFKTNTVGFILSKRTIYIAATLGFIFSLLVSLLTTQIASAFAGGNGTSGNPYQIANCAQFKTIENDLDAYYVLNQSIDCSSDGINAIISSDDFEGNFDGQDFTITLNVQASGWYRVGLFSELQGATVRNLTVAGTVSVQESDGITAESIGGLAGTIDDSLITDINVTANVYGDLSVGSIAGYVSNSVASDLTSSGDVETTYNNAGGLFGSSSYIQLYDSSSESSVYSGNINAGGIIGLDEDYEGDRSVLSGVTASGEVFANQSYAGGIVGHGTETAIEFSSATGNEYVRSNDGTGGLIGYLTSGSVVRSHSERFVMSYSYAGGFIGYSNNNEINQSHATGNLNIDSEYAGGFIGYLNGGSIYESFATGDVVTESSLYSAGGFAGMVGGDTLISDSYAKGDITAEGQAGGFSGYNDSSYVFRSYSTGAVYVDDEESPFGGFNGETGDAAIVDSFWDTETSGLANSSGGTGKTTNEMKDLDTYTTAANLDEGSWDFIGNENDDSGDDDIWGLTSEINDGYPCLVWYDENCTVDVGDEEPEPEPEPEPEIEAPDSDGDGISDSEEDYAPNEGDANNDGFDDSEQNNVSSFINPVTNTYTSVVLDDDCTITEASSNSEDSNNVKDSGYSYNKGFTNFAANCGDPGYTTSVSIYQYGVIKDGLTVRKYYPGTGIYSTIDTASLTQETIGDRIVTIASYQITDGGILDTDGEENGRITDPVGLGSAEVNSPNTGIGRVSKFLGL